MKMIPVASPDISKYEWNLVRKCLATGWISSIGKFVEIFEEEFSNFCGVKYGIATSSGTASLHLALATIGIKRGDEVIVPSLTFVATANAVSFTGARPVFADIKPENWNIDPEDVVKKITKRTKAIIAVHLYGHPAEMDTLKTIAEKNGLYLIEDAAQGHGAEYKGRKVGSFGDIACFSFYGNKIITTGEGGMLITNNKKFAIRARFLKDQAMSSKKKYWHSEIGFNYRMTNLQAAVGVGQLKRIDRIIEKKRKVAFMYNEYLGGIPAITIPPELPEVKSVYWMYSILINPKAIGRGRMMKLLAKRGIDTRPFFYPLNRLPMYCNSCRCPVAEDISRRGINLPSSSSLSGKEIYFISNTIKKIVQKKK